MQGNRHIIERLNQLLTGELTAADQYLIHSRMYQNWGFEKLYERIAHEAQDELHHADALIKRILFLEGTPDVGKRDPLHVGSNVTEMLKNDLALELSVIAALREAITVCEQQRDYQTREVLRAMLEDTEHDHTHWLEKQLGLIERIGLENYLQSQL
jgi:bacterioferritin